MLIYKTTKPFKNKLNNKIEERMLRLMENKLFFAATDVQEMLGVPLSYAYELIRKLNADQEAKGLVAIKGRISSKYLMKRIYGLFDEEKEVG